MKKTFLPLGTLALLALACGGGSSDSSPQNATVSGTVFASQVRNAQVQFVDLGGNVMAGPTTSDTDGSYQLFLPSSVLARDLILECSGGNFIDEATGNLTLAGNLSSYFAANTLAHQTLASATPATTLLREIMRQHDKTFSEAKSLFASNFGYTPDSSITPTDATQPTSGATASTNLEGLRAAQLSQMAKDLGLQPTQQFELFIKLAQDLGDGELDGQWSGNILSIGNNSLPRDIGSKFAQAATHFQSSGHDKTGLPPTSAAFHKVAYTSGGNYRVQWTSSVMGTMDAGATTGKSSLILSVSDLEGLPVSNLQPTVTPTMYMAAHHHSTPVETISNLGSGNYGLNIYYLMPSTMGSINMGTWELSIAFGAGDVARFYPNVKMKMNGSASVNFKGSGEDIISVDHMDHSAEHSHESRSYIIFPEKLDLGMSGNSLRLFIAAKESLMSYPALSSGNTLNSGETHSLSIKSATVGIRFNNQNYNSEELGLGHYIIRNLQGVSSGNAATFSVNLKVNDTFKTTDGTEPSESNIDSELSINPSSMSM